MLSSKITFLVAGISLTLGFHGASTTLGCDSLVRDGAFRTPRDVHRICVIAGSDDVDAEATSSKLSDWLATAGEGLNLELKRIDVEDPNILWGEFGIPSAPPIVPVVVLVGRGHGVGNYFVMNHWEPAPVDEDLKRLVQSPIRQQLQQQLGRRLAVLLYAAGSTTTGSTERTLSQVVKKWSGQSELGISVLNLDRTDDRERTLLSFAGIDTSGPDWLGVVFGRGKLMAPPLVGNDITEGRIDELIGQLIQQCACSKPLPTMGVDLPLVWNNELDKTLVAISDAVDAAQTGATETVLPSLATSLSSLESPNLERPVASGNNSRTGSHLLQVTIGMAILSVTIITGISCIMIWRNRQSNWRLRDS